jgi:protein-disulfide isomerase/predicted transcriptional regulator
MAIAAASCSKSGPDAAQAAPSTNDGIPEVLASIGDQKITLADLRDRIGDQLDQLDANYKKSRSKAIEDALSSMLRERIINEEAQKQGKSMEDLVLAEAGGTFEPTEVEITSWYNDNQARLRGRNLDQLRPQIVELLRKQKQDKAEQSLESRLNKARNVKVNFEPYRLAFDNTGAPSIGKRGSKVTVVEFSDFQCPFCRQFAGNLRELGREYGDRVEIVYKQYPIPSLHPFAFKAAEASLCANEQGKFWELHDLMFTDQEHIGVKDLKEKARRLGMDGNKFNTCLDTGKYTEQVQREMAEGSKAGVTGTPALFVNGIEVPGGAVPYPTVAAAVERELQRTGTTK